MMGGKIESWRHFKELNFLNVPLLLVSPYHLYELCHTCEQPGLLFLSTFKMDSIIY